MQTLGTPVNDEHMCCVAASPTLFYPAGFTSLLLCAGLNLLLEMLQSFQHSDFATQFHKTYYLNLMQEIFAVMTGVHRHYTVSCFYSAVLFLTVLSCVLPVIFCFLLILSCFLPVMSCCLPCCSVTIMSSRDTPSFSLPPFFGVCLIGFTSFRLKAFLCFILSHLILLRCDIITKSHHVAHPLVRFSPLLTQCHLTQSHLTQSHLLHFISLCLPCPLLSSPHLLSPLLTYPPLTLPPTPH